MISRKLLTTLAKEIVLILLIAGISIGLYYLFYGIDLSYDTYFDMVLFEIRRLFLVIEIVSNFFIPIYAVVAIGRLIYTKFQKLYVLMEVIISSFLWMATFFLTYLELGSDSLVPAKEGWTIYPPLSNVPVLNKMDLDRLDSERNHQLLMMFAIFIVTLILSIITIKQRKKLKVL